MELLKNTERFTTPDESSNLKDSVANIFRYIHKQIFWIEGFYSEIAKRVNWAVGRLNKGEEVSGTFTTTDGKTVTVENGLITKIE